MCTSFIGCTNTNTTANASPAAEDTSKDDGMPYKVAPYPTVDFIQEWKCQNWCDVEWAPHLDKLKKCGIEQIILQCSYNVDDQGKVSCQVFPDDEHPDNRGLEFLLQEAQERGMKVWIGSAYTAEWDQNKFVSADWADEQININKTNFKKMYDMYKEKYPDAFYGWYYSYEMWTNKVYWIKWADMLNKFIDVCNEIDPNMPVSLSPYIQQDSGMSPEEVGQAWQHFMDRVKFRPIDCVCPQFSWTGNDIPLEQCYAINDQIEKAVKSKDCHYWLNIESFNDKGKCADYTEWEEVLRHGAKRCERIASFSLSHTQLDTSVSGKNGYLNHKAYVERIKQEFDGKL